VLKNEVCRSVTQIVHFIISVNYIYPQALHTAHSMRLRIKKRPILAVAWYPDST
jgi:hypothetical protein